MFMQTIEEPISDSHIVQWHAGDGFTRHRSFATREAADRFAMQLECRLSIDALRRETKRYG